MESDFDATTKTPIPTIYDIWKGLCAGLLLPFYLWEGVNIGSGMHISVNDAAMLPAGYGVIGDYLWEGVNIGSGMHVSINDAAMLPAGYGVIGDVDAPLQSCNDNYQGINGCLPLMEGRIPYILQFNWHPYLS